MDGEALKTRRDDFSEDDNNDVVVAAMKTNIKKTCDGDLATINVSQWAKFVHTKPNADDDEPQLNSSSVSAVDLSISSPLTEVCLEICVHLLQQLTRTPCVC